jgi:uridine kinase
MTDVRNRVVGRIADHLAGLVPSSSVLRVGVDGVTAVGKTTFADSLASALRDRGTPVIRVSMDGFHHPRAHRHRRGRTSADGYYEDAYDFAAAARVLLEPLGPGGPMRYLPAVLDLAADAPLAPDPQVAAPGSVLIVDGSFLQRALVLDEVVFLAASFDAARARGTRRDALPESLYRERYHAAGARYLDEVSPARRASVLVDLEDPLTPRLIRIGGPAALFSYGTLQSAPVQEALFGRTLDVHPATVRRHRQEWLRITNPEVIAASGTDRHPVVRWTGRASDTVSGSVLSLTGEELAAADGYEVDDYRRQRVELEDGGRAWMYRAV